MHPHCSISWPRLGFTLETVLRVIIAQKWPSELHVRARLQALARHMAVWCF